MAACLAGVAFSVSFAASPGAEPSSVVVETVAGESLEKPGFQSISDGVVRFGDGSSVPVVDLRSLRFSGGKAASENTPEAVIHLAGGGRLPAGDAILVDDACQVTLSEDHKATLSLDDVAAIQWSATADAAWSDALAKPSEDNDIVVLKAQPQATAVRAFVETIGLDSIEFDWDKETRKLQKSQVVGVVFARPDKSPPVQARVRTAEGGVLPVTSLALADDARKVQVTLLRGSSLEIPADAVTSIEIESPRLKWLSSVTPGRVVERPITALPRAWKADLNVRGEPLKAGGRTFDRGIGVQSGTSLTYELDGLAEQFAAIVSVDAPDGIAGDCEFVVLVDDKEMARQHIRTGDQPAAVRVPLKGARRLELRVDYGSNLDFGDHANWCDAHLVLRAPENVRE